MIRWFLIALALICLAVGILWQNGIIDPLKLYRTLTTAEVEESIQPTPKKRVKIPIEKYPKETTNRVHFTTP